MHMCTYMRVNLCVYYMSVYQSEKLQKLPNRAARANYNVVTPLQNTMGGTHLAYAEKRLKNIS